MFDIDLYRRLAAAPGNLFFSPYSVAAALALVHAGAEGATRKELEAVLGHADPVDAYGPDGELEGRTMYHVAVMMLARVDGKSPLAYLTEDQRVRIRAHARRRILEPVDRLSRYL